MTDALLIDAAEYAPFGEARIVVEISGRWVQVPPVPSGESALMIVDGNGLVHRFAEISSGLQDVQAGDEYHGSFVVPAQFRGRIASPTAVRAGGLTVTVPGATLAAGADDDEPEPVISVARLTPPVAAAPGSAADDPVIAALREELRQRVAEGTGLRREVGELRSQLDARARNAERLEHAQAELRAALGELTERLETHDGHRVALESSNVALEAANATLSAEVASLRAMLELTQAEITRVAAERDAALSELGDRYAELAATKVSHEAALEEVDELRRELERGGAELAEVREQFGSSEVEEAESLLAETRALTARLMGRGGESHATDDARD